MYRGHMCIVFPKLGISLYDFMKNNDYRGFKMHHVKVMSYKLIQAIKCKQFVVFYYYVFYI